MTGNLGKYNTFGRERSYKMARPDLGEKDILSPLYIISLALITLGIVLVNIKEKKVAKN